MEDQVTELSPPSSGGRRRIPTFHPDATRPGTTSPPFFPPPQASTATSKPLTRRPHHSGGGKLSGIWRPPFERTWSVPEQYATANTSSPVSKGSSRSSIEQVIPREEGQARRNFINQQVVIEAPVHSLLKMPSVDRGSKDHISSRNAYPRREDAKYLEDPLVDLSFSPPPNFGSIHPPQPPSYSKVQPEFGKGAFHPPTAIAGNIYSNPSHFSSQQKFQSHAGTPVEVKLSSCGSPVQFCPLNLNNQVGGSAGGIGGGGRNLRHRITDLTHRPAPCCNTQPNSPTSSRQKGLLGRIRRFPSLKLQRHTPVTSPGTINKGTSVQQPLLLRNNLQQARKIKHRSTPTLPEGAVGPTITVTTHSEDELNRNHHDRVKPTFAFNSVVHLGDDTSLYGTPKEQTSPPLGGGTSNGGDHFKFSNNSNNTASSSNVNNPNNTTSTSNYLRDQIISFFQPSDNKLAMKLFGNKNALMKEKMRQKAAGNWVIHPCSNFRFYWDLFMLVLLIANLIILPVAISFFNDDLSTKWIVFNGLSDTVFLLDLIINFRTGIIADNFADDIILEPREIAKHYLKTWFFLDLISSIPLDYIILLFSPDANITQLIHAGRALRIVRLVKLLSLLRLLRLSRLVRYVSQWEEFLTVASKFMRIVNLVCLILLLGHWNGCLQWLVPMIQEFPRDSWAALEELQGAHWTEQYTWALFKALSHMLCIGYGRYPPQSTTDVWLTTVSMLTGATCYALFVGHSTTLIQSFDTSRRLYREKFKQVEEYMIYRKLPRKLRQKITDYYEHRYQGKMFDEQSILAEVNECLREEIINYNCRALVASVPFFTHADPNFVSDIVTNLRHEMFQPGDFIIREGSVGTKVYFIQEGIVDIITQNGEVATSLSDGSYFGEICLLAKTKRTASVRAEAYCNLFSLSVEHFDAVLERYPLMRRTMESVAAERLNKIGKDPCILSNRDDLEADISMVNELIMRATPLPSSGSEDSDGNGGMTDDDRKPQKKRKKRDDQGSTSGAQGGKDHKEKDTLTVKLATILRRSRSNINMRQASKDEK